MLFNSSVKVDDTFACGLDFETQCWIANADDDGEAKETNESVSLILPGLFLRNRWERKWNEDIDGESKLCVPVALVSSLKIPLAFRTAFSFRIFSKLCWSKAKLSSFISGTLLLWLCEMKPLSFSVLLLLERFAGIDLAWLSLELFLVLLGSFEVS